MTNEKNKLTKEEEIQEYHECAKDIHDTITDILENDERGNISERIHFIGQTIARRQISDIDMASCLHILIDSFNDEMINYKEVMNKENEKIQNSLAKFRRSIGEEVINFNNKDQDERTIN